MRLVDQIVCAPTEVMARDSKGSKHRLPGVGAKATLIEQCFLRYIVDRAASQECLDLMRSDVGLLTAENVLLRMPAEQLWIEWVVEAATPTAAEHRVGALVESDTSGRRGTVTTFWRDRFGRADVCVAEIEFDLDHELSLTPNSPTVRRLRHSSLPHLDRLFRHTLLRVGLAWSRFMKANNSAGYQKNLSELAELTWFAFPFVLAFATLVNEERTFEQRGSDLSRLNLARLKRGRRPLLDHIDISMELGAVQGQGIGLSGGGRRKARHHLVRGHMVMRGGKAFWRSTHLRGDRTRPITQKTVYVKGARASPLVGIRTPRADAQ